MSESNRLVPLSQPRIRCTITDDRREAAVALVKPGAGCDSFNPNSLVQPAFLERDPMNTEKTSYETLGYEVADNILTLTLNRPEKLNAFTGTMMLELIDAFDRADADDEVRAIIVTGAGRAFCAGADLSAGAKTFDFAQRTDRPDKQGTPVKENGETDWGHPSVRDGGGRVSLRIYECLKPVIAAVNGPAVGIGVTMQLPMDIRLASENARFGFVFARHQGKADGAFDADLEVGELERSGQHLLNAIGKTFVTVRRWAIADLNSL